MGVHAALPDCASACINRPPTDSGGKYKASQRCQRKQPTAELSSVADAAGAGTRAGLHGQTLVSTGHADLDRVLGGGLPLGTLLVVLEDAASPHADTLLRCFAAEGVACGHQARSNCRSCAACSSVTGLLLLHLAVLQRGQSRRAQPAMPLLTQMPSS